eukprot:2605322-Pleurochrysis_carterae.AAC.1
MGPRGDRAPDGGSAPHGHGAVMRTPVHRRIRGRTATAPRPLRVASTALRDSGQSGVHGGTSSDGHGDGGDGPGAGVTDGGDGGRYGGEGGRGGHGATGVGDDPTTEDGGGDGWAARAARVLIAFSGDGTARSTLASELRRRGTEVVAIDTPSRGPRPRPHQRRGGGGDTALRRVRGGLFGAVFAAPPCVLFSV